MRINNHDPIYWKGHPVKEGDKLLCIKSFPSTGFATLFTGILEHTAGREYKILSIGHNVVRIENNFGYLQEYMHNDDLDANRRVWEYFEPPIVTERRNKIKKLSS